MRKLLATPSMTAWNSAAAVISYRRAGGGGRGRRGAVTAALRLRHGSIGVCPLCASLLARFRLGCSSSYLKRSATSTTTPAQQTSWDLIHVATLRCGAIDARRRSGLMGRRRVSGYDAKETQISIIMIDCSGSIGVKTRGRKRVAAHYALAPARHVLPLPRAAARDCRGEGRGRSKTAAAAITACARYRCHVPLRSGPCAVPRGEMLP